MSSRFSLARGVSCLFLVVLSTLYCHSTQAASFTNPDFETGDLAGWTTAANQMTIQVATNRSFNRNYAARIDGRYAAASWITNSISQTAQAVPGDVITALGFVSWPTQALGAGGATGRLEATLSGPFGTNTKVWLTPFEGWDFFQFEGGLYGKTNTGFESGDFCSWQVNCSKLVATVSSPAAVFQWTVALVAVPRLPRTPKPMESGAPSPLRSSIQEIATGDAFNGPQRDRSPGLLPFASPEYPPNRMESPGWMGLAVGVMAILTRFPTMVAVPGTGRREMVLPVKAKAESPAGRAAPMAETIASEAST